MLCVRPYTSAFRRALLVVTAGALGSCGLVDYEADPIDVDAIVEQLAQQRLHTVEAVASGSLSVADVEALALQRDPSVREAVATFEASLALDDVRARWRDPSIGVGVNGAIGPGVTRRRVAPSANARVMIPLSRRRSREDARDLAQVEVAAAAVDRAARLAILAARHRWIDVGLADERLAARQEVVATLENTVAAAEALARTGAASGLDLALLQLELSRAEQARFGASVERDAARAALATQLLLSPADLDGVEIDAPALLSAAPPLPDGPSDLAEFGRTTRTDLDVLRSRHALSEAQLALEIALQIQDLGIGASLSPEPAEAFTIVGLALSGALPIFRRNVQAIATATAQRTAANARFGIGMDRATAEIAAAHACAIRAMSRFAYFETETQPAVARVVETAERAVRAGSANALALLSAARTRADLRYQQVTLRQAVVRGYMALERALEAPLLTRSASVLKGSASVLMGSASGETGTWSGHPTIRAWREDR